MRPGFLFGDLAAWQCKEGDGRRHMVGGKESKDVRVVLEALDREAGGSKHWFTL